MNNSVFMQTASTDAIHGDEDWIDESKYDKDDLIINKFAIDEQAFLEGLCEGDNNHLFALLATARSLEKDGKEGAVDEAGKMLVRILTNRVFDYGKEIV